MLSNYVSECDISRCEMFRPAPVDEFMANLLIVSSRAHAFYGRIWQNLAASELQYYKVDRPLNSSQKIVPHLASPCPTLARQGVMPVGL